MIIIINKYVGAKWRKRNVWCLHISKGEFSELFPLLHGPMDGSILPCHPEAHPTHATSSSSHRLISLMNETKRYYSHCIRD
jgi:hypothetical protein